MRAYNLVITHDSVGASGNYRYHEADGGFNKVQSKIRGRMADVSTSSYGEEGHGAFYNFVCEKLGENRVSAWVRGTDLGGYRGIMVSQMRSLPVSLYCGDLFDNNAVAIVPKNRESLGALWAFCSSGEFQAEIRNLNQKISVDPGYMITVAFDLERWQLVAEEMAPLPEPCSDDPTQWLFNGNPSDSTDPLQVAVARLLGYRWPQQDPDCLSILADQDGILPLVPLSGEEPAAERLRTILAAAYRGSWSQAVQERLLQQAGFNGKGLEIWLRDGFFEQHCKLFHQRPFIWHIWDGRKDGFSALVNYHKLDSALLDKLIYTCLGRLDQDTAFRSRCGDTRSGRPSSRLRGASEETGSYPSRRSTI